MAKVNFVFGMITGRLGDKVYYIRKGKQYVKSIPEKVANPRTPRQEANRQRYKLAAGFASKELSGIINIGYQGDKKMDPRSAFMSHLLRVAVKGTWPDQYLDYPSILISRGHLRPPLNFKSAHMGKKLVISWDSDWNGFDSRCDDELILVLHNEAGEFSIHRHLSQRVDEYVAVDLPEKFTKNIHAWLFCYDEDNCYGSNKNKISDSIYLGKF